MRGIINIIFLALGSQLLSAQTALDLARFSTYDVSGSARGLAVGGSMSAIGGDMGLLSINPAGIATYHFSELQLSMGINGSSVETTLRDHGQNTASLTGSPFVLSNAGYVKVRKDAYSNWSRQNWGITINRVADFNETIRYQGEGNGSIADKWLEDAVFDGFPSDPFGSSLAFDAGAIYDFDDNPGVYFNDFDVVNTVQRNERIERSGGVTEINGTYGAALGTKWSLGVSGGLSIINFNENKTYTERDPGDVNPIFEELTYNQNLDVDGTGFNIKLGAIYSPTPKLKIGTYIHSPIFYAINEEYTTDLIYLFEGRNPDDELLNQSPLNQIEYNIYTPWRFGLDAGLILGNKGFISADVAYVNYRGASFDFTTIDNTIENEILQDQLNDEVEELLNSGFDIKAGAELALGKYARLRGGIQLLTPVATAGEGFTIDNAVLETRKVYSAGIGLRKDRFFLDVAYQIEDNTNTYVPYTIFDEFSFGATPVANFNRTNSRLIVSLGVKLNPKDVSREYEQF